MIYTLGVASQIIFQSHCEATIHALIGHIKVHIKHKDKHSTSNKLKFIHLDFKLRVHEISYIKVLDKIN